MSEPVERGQNEAYAQNGLPIDNQQDRPYRVQTPGDEKPYKKYCQRIFCQRPPRLIDVEQPCHNPLNFTC